MKPDDSTWFGREWPFFGKKKANFNSKAQKPEEQTETNPFLFGVPTVAAGEEQANYAQPHQRIMRRFGDGHHWFIHFKSWRGA